MIVNSKVKFKLGSFLTFCVVHVLTYQKIKLGLSLFNVHK